MDIIRAREIIRSLAEGVDPTTGEVFSKESTFNTPGCDTCVVYCFGSDYTKNNGIFGY